MAERSVRHFVAKSADIEIRFDLPSERRAVGKSCLLSQAQEKTSLKIRPKLQGREYFELNLYDPVFI